jgi:hypothetical protein
MAQAEYTADEIEQFYRILLDEAGLHHDKGNEFRSRCVLFSHTGENPNSLWVNMETGGFCCHACHVKGGGIYSFAQEVLRRKSAAGQAPESGAVTEWIHQTLGTPFVQRVYPEPVQGKPSGYRWDRSKAQDSYIYTDRLGQELCRVYRFIDAYGNKITPVDHPCPCVLDPKATCEPGCVNGRVWGAKNVRRVLYHLIDVLQAILIFVVEGEKNANDLARALALYISKRDGFRLGKLMLDRVAVTTNMGGSGGWKPDYGYGRVFAEKIVVKLGDNDTAGRIHDKAVCEDVCRYAAELYTLDLHVGEGEDISDFIKQHVPRPIEDLIQLLETERKPYATAPVKSAKVGESVPQPRVILVHPVQLGSKADLQGDMLVDGLIERGHRGLVVAPPKVGKSLLFLDLAVSLASKTGFLGARPYGRRVRSAIISREDGPELVRRRLTQLAAGRNLKLEDIDPFILVNTVKQSSSFHIDAQKDLEEMAQWLKAEQVEFCILDVLNRLHFQKENSADEMTQVMAKFDELAELSGAQVCVIHHASRAGNSRGSTSIEGWADFICKLEADTTDESIKTISIRTKATGLIEPRTLRYWQSPDRSQSRIMLVAKIETGDGYEKRSPFGGGSRANVM